MDLARRPKLTARERRLICSLTSLPTASGKEHLVESAIAMLVEAHSPRLHMRRDTIGNLLITTRSRATRNRATPKLLITAHLDHPAFVVRRMISPRDVELEFRGGVHDPYFERAAIEVFGDDGQPLAARITALDAKAKPFKRVRARLEIAVGGGSRGRSKRGASAEARVSRGNLARWQLPAAEIRAGLLHAPACDDLAAVAIALISFQRLVDHDAADGVGLLFTVAEEVGFLGAIHAAKSSIVPKGASLLCLENSRSFPHDSPIGAGAILRVGDRLSVFSPDLTNALTQLYQAHGAKTPSFQWQRKLMPGGACEATAFAALGHRSTCLCLPLGNYHNMCEIDAVLAGRRPALVAREFVAVSDIESLVWMLLLAAQSARSDSAQSTARTTHPHRPLMEKLWRDRAKAIFGRTALP